ncbi:porin family protein [Sphingomonadaceae bacterium G21617-S1]|jgi:outer membrane immunogenic protein|uniref:outer membrane protein n=1 Tax=Rhizorhabdus sp. TaxID=1968843 RepID=UPI0012094615|nr:porin family protein [Rhizorhabdus sp.]MBD3762636.1 porin family protein [Rhizorhabdus sp.]MCZ4341745.1 porin family protein [Sphingomonadaceae bacterium G21617-S1]TAK10834.1 MAG: porin family protein [Rhizorhabdus sp.]
MRSIVVAALLAASAAAPALAQDRAPFTGARVEGLAGWDRVQNNGHDDGIQYGLGAGYDFQTGMGLVGIEAEAADSSVKQCAGASTLASPRLCAKAGRDLYVGGRVGTVVGGRTLLYAKAGYTNAQAKLTSNDGTGQVTLGKTNLDGVRVGAGAEYAVGPNSFVKTEYRYSNYENGFSRHQVVAGFGFRF